VFFNHPTGLDELIELFLNDEKYANTIQTVCPHILRYLTTAVIAQAQNQKNKGVMKSLVKVIQQEAYTYKDPITEFVECLYVRFDFDGAQQKLRECETVGERTFFHTPRHVPAFFPQLCSSGLELSQNAPATIPQLTREGFWRWMHIISLCFFILRCS
jgi:hypothetical protein